MHLFVQACILGILIGGVYALMSSGLTLVFGIMRVVNVAQGAMVILGAYLGYSHSSCYSGVSRSPGLRVIGFALSVAILTGLYFLLARSRFGRSVRATVQNPTSAELLRVGPDRVSSFGFGIRVATASAAGAV